MSTSDVVGDGVPTDGEGPAVGLPDVATLTALANEFFRALPDGATVAPSAAPGNLPPPAPLSPPSPSLRSQPAPPTSAATASAPLPGPLVSPVPVPDAPYLTELPPPLGVASFTTLPSLPPGVPAPPDLVALLSLADGPATADPPAAEVPQPLASSVPTASHDVATTPAFEQPAGSPVPMPDEVQLAQVPTTLGAVMGFVAAVPFMPVVPSATPDAAEPSSLEGVPDPLAVPVSAQPAVAYPMDEAGSALASPVRSADLQISESSLGFHPDLVPTLERAPGPFDPHLVRGDFPILRTQVHGKRLVWLDNAATTQKPQAVIDRLSHFYEHENSNIHRAAHVLAARATDAYEAARDKVRRFLNAPSDEEVVFVRGTTEGINLVAQSWGIANLDRGDEVLITWLEHHANIVPWQQVCARTGAVLRVAPVDDTGQVVLSEYQRLITPRTRLVAFTQVSNALGTITPAAAMIDIAHRHGVPVLLDGAQSVSHMPTDVQALDCDFFVFSGHKVFGPTGIGVVYGKKRLLEDMPPWQGGGNMIADVTFERTVYQHPPSKFEAGTGNIADAVGLGAALDYLSGIGVANVAAYEHELLGYATDGLRTIPGLRLIGTAADKAGVISFVLDGFRTEDVGAALDREGIAVRAGHHCAQPILRRFGVESTVRPSLALYNTPEDVDCLVEALRKIQAGRP
ncbi:MAG TPA: family 2A encapsulin nanocompartment cargo protein cysteine desulfurase [Actinomycetes bacterium]|nr:family 2A encapsulin nanocompartment cargo protein cysteine desulfurase [Actinomycetes bacterium]